MPAEYAKLKNAELEALLKERGLPHGGKKADMVERLQKNDEDNKAAAAKAALNAEDEIDWDDDADETAPAPAPEPVQPVAANAAPVATAGGEVQAVSTKVADIDIAKTDDVATEAPAEGEKTNVDETKPEEKANPVPDYSIGLAATDLDAEIEKRKKRALKFGSKIEDDEGLKRLERAKKFGEVVDAAGLTAGLDGALPNKREREDGDEGSNAKKRRGGPSGGRGGRGGHGGHGGRGGRDGRDRPQHKNNDGRDNRNEGKKTTGGSSWMSAEDKAAAEKRKAKWAKPTA